MKPVRPLPFLCALVATAASPWAGWSQEPPPAELAGSWSGSLPVPGGGSLRLVLHLTSDGAQGYTATLDSPDQGARGIPVATVDVQGDELSLDLPDLAAGYVGALEGDSIRGTWKQGGLEMPLVFGRGEGEPTPVRRPQDPHPPYPYEALDVAFENPSAGIRLAGTLTIPGGPGPHAAVLLVSGSGPQDRDETLLGHRPFLVLADHLTRRGIAVLRYDDRGVGGSTGNHASATSEDLASDALAGVRYLRSRPEVDAGRVGLVGHSEGGLIGPMVATQTDEVGFLVLLAPPGLPGEEILRLQGERIARANGASEEAIAANRSIQDESFALVRAGADTSRVADALRERVERLREGGGAGALDALGLTARNVEPWVQAQVRVLFSPWLRFFLDYDPVPALTQLRVPVLALIGEKDLQVPAPENVPALRAALARSASPRHEVRTLPGLNHLFQTAGTGVPAEYGALEETFAPVALELVGDWILEVTGR